MKTKNNIATCIGVFLSCLMFVSHAAYAGVAGYAQFVIGNVQVVSETGQTRSLQKGAAVNEGDTVITAKSASTQIKMQDGGLVAMRPDSKLKLDSFKFNGKEDGNERVFFSLIKGGFRSITGLIGRSNKTSYRISTAVATIGIRGTDHETIVVTRDSLLASTVPSGVYNKVNVGETFMATEKGTIFVLPNQMGFAGGADQMPQLQPLNTNLFTVTTQPTSSGKVDKKEGAAVRDAAAVDPGEQAPVVAKNAPVTVIEPLIIPICTTNPVTGQCVDLLATTPPSLTVGGNGVKFTATTGLEGIDSVTAPHATGTQPLLTGVSPIPPGTTYTFDALGLTRYDCGYLGHLCFAAQGTAQLVDVGWDGGIVHWGRWSNGVTSAGGWGNNLFFGPNQGWHFIVGIPTPLAQLPVNATFTYNLIGGTSPTPSDGVGGGLGTGNLISGSATANFTNATINGNLVMGFSGASIYRADYSGSLGYGMNITGTTNYQSGNINVCGIEGCMTKYQGQFYGSNATDLGVGFNITTNQSFNINGVAAYKR